MNMCREKGWKIKGIFYRGAQKRKKTGIKEIIKKGKKDGRTGRLTGIKRRMYKKSK